MVEEEESSAVLLKNETDVSMDSKLSTDDCVIHNSSSNHNIVISQEYQVEKVEEREVEVDIDLKREMVGEIDVKGVVESVGQICNVCLAITSDLEDHSR